MTCRAHRDAILDLARGVTVPSALRRAAEGHLKECASCDAQLRRQRELTSALEMLAAGSSTIDAGPALEERLLEIFVTGRERPWRAAPGGWSRVPRWVGIAATLAIVAIGTWNLRSRGVADVRPDSAALKTTQLRPAGVSAAPTPTSREPLMRDAASVSTARPKPKVPRARSRAKPGAVSPVEFVTIPGAVGLPPLESASIVRTELPVSALPAYGLAIAPDGARSAVEADLLVGQDGQPRAIRLVTAQQRP